jgi:hypothetical protein
MLLEECQRPLHSHSILAVHPDYTAAVIRAAIEIAYSAGVKAASLASPADFRVAVNARATNYNSDGDPR